MEGLAPFSFYNRNQQLDGIAIQVLDEIAAMTGLKFETTLVQSFDYDRDYNKYDLLLITTKDYAYPPLELSEAYLNQN